MRRRFQLNWVRFIAQLLPPFLQGETLRTFIYTLLGSLVSLDAQTDRHTGQLCYRLSHSPMRIHLQKVLNDVFDKAQRGIRVRNRLDLDPSWFAAYREDKPNWFAPQGQGDLVDGPRYFVDSAYRSTYTDGFRPIQSLVKPSFPDRSEHDDQKAVFFGRHYFLQRGQHPEIDFYVFLPHRLKPADEKQQKAWVGQLRGQLNYYKEPDKTYGIKWLPATPAEGITAKRTLNINNSL